MIIGSYVFGSKKLNLSRLKNFKKIFQRTGTRLVRRANLNENTFNLAIRAIQKIKSRINIKKIESIIFITQSPYSLIPPTSSLIHKEFGFSKKCFTLDIVQGCSSFPYAFFLANRYINNGVFKNCLIVSSEVYGKYIESKNRSCNPIFSDGASVLYFDKNTKLKIFSEIYRTDGSGSGKLCLDKRKKLFMDGPAVFQFTKKEVPDAVKILLKDSKLKINNIDSFYFHQASKLVLDTIRDELKIPDYKIIRSPNNYGNTVSSTIPILIIDQLNKKKIKKNKNILMMGFGVGYSLSGGIIKFE